jgi:hypothetical protein
MAPDRKGPIMDRYEALPTTRVDLYAVVDMSNGLGMDAAGGFGDIRKAQRWSAPVALAKAAELNGAEQQGKEGYPPLPRFPRAAHYQGSARKRFEAGVRAAKRYYATFPQDGYSRAIERADGRNEPSAWYDGWDSVCNPSYFEAK